MDTTDRVEADERVTRTRAIGSIQPTGLLMLLSDDWLVEGASANMVSFVGRSPAELIGRPAADFLSVDAVHALRNRLALLRDPAGVEHIFAYPLLGDERRFDVAIHCSDGLVVVEAEPSTAKPYGDVTATLRGMLSRLDQAGDRASFLSEGARQLRALTGFDRVMALRFTEDGSSEVVAECARGGVGTMIGTIWSADLFPFDEPAVLAQAPLHLVPDLAADLTPVEISAALGVERLDLMRAVLRPAAPAYADALRSTGVRAAMTIALVVDGAPWGAIACHHHLPRCPSFERRAICELFAQLFAMRIEIIQLKEALAQHDRG